ncbi:PAPS reductase domain protein [Bacillus phage 031MP004]|nr:PAPS reductase domain protein [Bacillus phage 031MP003]QFG05570.1 PAPS reductase domain protein [Bacillus phage 031MP002]QFG05657.1 PAPS reductase domain protein [Bacillus phage 031MP004]
MSKMKGYIDANVYEEAKRRIKHVMNTFDKLYVAFSGGKDSLAALHLVEEVYREEGLTDKVNVIFRDEELIPDDVIDFVQEYYSSGKYNFKYFAVPLKSQKFILGKTYEYIQWDEHREWVREKPPFAITGEKGVIYDQYTLDEYATREDKGRVAIITGIRADESLVRFRAAVNKRDENYINASSIPNVKLVKPLFDWTEKDIFKYFYDNDIRYCHIYDKQVWNKEELRVSTPIHAERAKRFDKLKSIYPQFYQQIVSIFPEMLVQERYWKDYDRYGIIDKYPNTWDGVLQYIKENITDPAEQKLAKTRLIHAKTFRENTMKKNPKTKKNFGGYPLLYVFKTIVDGGYKRKIQPKKQITQKELDYEVQRPAKD